MVKKFILASSSPARKALMDRLFLPYQAISPDVDETAQPNESHRALVQRLSRAKAEKIAAQHPEAICIGSDAIASVNGEVLGKPLTHENAVLQLEKMSNQVVEFITGLCVTQQSTGKRMEDVVITRVHYRPLSAEVISHYLQQAQPYHSAGSLHSEGLGIILMQQWEGEDPTALMGLPLIRLTTYLQDFDALMPTT